MLSATSTQLTRIELETLLDTQFLAFQQSLLAQILQGIVVDNTRLDGVTDLLNAAATWQDLTASTLADIQKQLNRIEGDVNAPAPGVAEQGSFLLGQTTNSQGTITMSNLALKVGDTFVCPMTFSEAGAVASPPANGAVASDNPAVATISLAADEFTYTVVALTAGTANMTYTGTGPDGGACVVPPLVVTVATIVAPETGDFNPAAGVTTGP